MTTRRHLAFTTLALWLLQGCHAVEALAPCDYLDCGEGDCRVHDGGEAFCECNDGARLVNGRCRGPDGDADADGDTDADMDADAYADADADENERPLGWIAGGGDEAHQTPMDVVIRPGSGSVALVGTNEGELTLQGCERITATGVDGFIADIAPNGSCTFIHPVSSTGETTLHAADVSTFGSTDELLVVGGEFSGISDLNALASTGGTDGLVFIYDLSVTDGSGLIRAVSFGGSGDDAVTAVLATNDFVLVAGHLGAGAATETSVLGCELGENVGADSRTVFVAKLSTELECERLLAVVAHQQTEIAAIEKDHEGRVFVAGSFHDERFGFAGAEPALNSDTSGGGTSADAFVSRLDLDRDNALQNWGIGGLGQDLAVGVVVDDAANVYVAGMTTSRSIVLDEAQINLQGSSDGFVASLAPNGMPRWIRAIGAVEPLGGHEDARSPVVDDDGRLWLTGTFASTIWAGPSGTLRTTGGNDAYVLALDQADGSILWGWSLGDRANSLEQGLALDVVGDVAALCGVFDGELSTVFGDVTGGGIRDLFALFFSLPLP